MIVTEYMNLGALDDFLRVSDRLDPWWESTNDIFFLALLFFSWGLGLPVLPLGRLT